jgi:hypothetical protein
VRANQCGSGTPRREHHGDVPVATALVTRDVLVDPDWRAFTAAIESHKHHLTSTLQRHRVKHRFGQADKTSLFPGRSRRRRNQPIKCEALQVKSSLSQWIVR